MLKWAPANMSRRTPRGVRGLKYTPGAVGGAYNKSHPARGAWIEISVSALKSASGTPSHPAWGAWIEIEQFDG